jgi:hypothetical protein
LTQLAPGHNNMVNMSWTGRTRNGLSISGKEKRFSYPQKDSGLDFVSTQLLSGIRGQEQLNLLHSRLYAMHKFCLLCVICIRKLVTWIKAYQWG